MGSSRPSASLRPCSKSGWSCLREQRQLLAQVLVQVANENGATRQMSTSRTPGSVDPTALPETVVLRGPMKCRLRPTQSTSTMRPQFANRSHECEPTRPPSPPSLQFSSFRWRRPRNTARPRRRRPHALAAPCVRACGGARARGACGDAGARSDTSTSISTSGDACTCGNPLCSAASKLR